MVRDMHRAPRLYPAVKRSAAAVILPICLALVFVVQNFAFNAWLHIVPQVNLQIVSATFGLGVLLFGPSVFMRPRNRAIYLVAMSLLTSILFSVEYLYFSFTGGYLQISALRLTSQMGAVYGTALRLIRPQLMFFFANLILVSAVASLARVRQVCSVSLSVGEKVLALMLILTAIFGGYGTLLAAETKNYGDDTRLYKQLYDLNSVVGKMGVVNYFLEDAAKRVLKAGDVTPEDKAFVEQWSSARSETEVSTPLSTAPSATPRSFYGLARGRNVIFIQVESLENAVMKTKVGGEEITPNLNKLLGEGLYFSNYYTQVGMGNTADAEFSSLNSLYPLPDSVAFVDHAQNRYAALPQQLVDHGYKTFVFHGDVPTFWNRANIYPNLGYQTWYMKSSYTISTPIGITGVGDEDLFEQSLPRVTSLPQPFMATLITLSSHTPFILPDNLRTLSIPSESGLNDTQQQYLESIHYTDQQLGAFMDQLKKSDVYAHSLIVIFGDHGSYTNISQALGMERQDVAGMNNNQVPLLILAPGTNLTGERTTPGSHVDIYPTVAHLLGMEPPRSALGLDLLDASTTHVVVSRKTGTGGISALVSEKDVYVAAPDGQFENGSCLEATTRQSVPLDTCRALYEQQAAILRVSDTVVRGNLVEQLLAPSATSSPSISSF